MYSDDKSSQLLVALLKKYNIRKIVVSPGSANASVVANVQSDSFFEIYSVVDERSAAYFALGLSYESGEAVVISCTGATASRNYLPALTEAYYRNLPIIAITSQRNNGDPDSLLAQYTNRTVAQNDIRHFDVHISRTMTNDDESRNIYFLNKAFAYAAKNKGKGTVHVNIVTDTQSFTTRVLPRVNKVDFFDSEDLIGNAETVSMLKRALYGKKVGVIISSHLKFSIECTKALEGFIRSSGAVVFCEHISNYHGKNKILISLFAKASERILPDVVIDIGGINGGYEFVRVIKKADIWKISEDGVYRRRGDKLAKQFDCSEELFFKALTDYSVISDNAYYNSVVRVIDNIVIPEMPLSNMFISSQVSKKLPKNCSLHIGILNSLRCMDYFSIDESIDCVSNVGGFGIDGPVSTLIGQAMNNTSKLCFGHMGDLAFFYDMNAMCIKEIPKNVRVLLVNNGLGVEFLLIKTLKPLGDKIENFIAAKDHNGSVRLWAESLGFEYISAATKSEFLGRLDDFYSPDLNKFDKPAIFEVFVDSKNESIGLKQFRKINLLKTRPRLFIKKLLPKKLKKLLKIFRKKKSLRN